jgi:hypothetical protein
MTLNLATLLEDSDARAYVCFEGTPDLPIGAEGYVEFAQSLPITASGKILTRELVRR